VSKYASFGPRTPKFEDFPGIIFFVSNIRNMPNAITVYIRKLRADIETTEYEMKQTTASPIPGKKAAMARHLKFLKGEYQMNIDLREMGHVKPSMSAGPPEKASFKLSKAQRLEHEKNALLNMADPLGQST
jgi:hypothetical protein